MVDNDLAKLIQALGARIWRSRERFLRIAAALAILGVLLLLALGDALLGLPLAGRLVAMAALAAGAIGAAAWLLLGMSARRPGFGAACRALEGAIGDDARDVTCAVQLGAMDGELAQRGAERLRAGLALEQAEGRLPRPPFARLLWLASGACFLVLAVQIACPGLWSSVLPRLFDPWGDHPPYSRTRLTLLEPPASVRAGATPQIAVRVDGPLAERPVLRIAAAGGGPAAELPMFQDEPGRWVARIAPVQEALRIWAAGGGTRSRYHQLALDPVPELRALELRLAQPAYAELPDERQRVQPDGRAAFAALEGARLQLQAEANRPLVALHLQRLGSDGATDADSTRLVLGEDGAWLDDPGPGSYLLVLEASDGIRSDPYRLFELKRRPDRPPEAVISQPPQDLLATPSMRLPLLLEADDDLGLGQVTRLVAHDHLEAPALVERVSGRHWELRGELDLAELGVKPGDSISIGVVARDRRPPDGQLGSWAQRHITIISEQRYNELLRRRLDEQALLQKYGPLLREIAELEAQAAALRQQGEGPERQRELDRLARLAQQLQRRVADMQRPEPLFEVEPELQQRLRRHLERLQRALESGELDQLPGAQSKGDANELADLAQLARGQGLVAYLRHIGRLQREVADQLERLREISSAELSDADRARLRDLEQRQRALEQALGRWQELAEQTAAALDERKPEASAALRQLLAALREQEVEQPMRQAAEAARERLASRAAEQAGEAARRLEALLPECEACSQCLGGQCQGMGMCSSAGASSALGALAQLALPGLGSQLFPGQPSGGGQGSSSGLSAFGLGAGGSGRSGSSPVAALGGTDPAAGEAGGMALAGPEVQLAQAQGDGRGEHGEGSGNQGVDQGSGEAQDATAYERGVRRGRAGSRVQLTPQEEHLVIDYFRRLTDGPGAGGTP